MDGDNETDFSFLSLALISAPPPSLLDLPSFLPPSSFPPLSQWRECCCMFQRSLHSCSSQSSAAMMSTIPPPANIHVYQEMSDRCLWSCLSLTGAPPPSSSSSSSSRFDLKPVLILFSSSSSSHPHPRPRPRPRHHFHHLHHTETHSPCYGAHLESSCIWGRHPKMLTHYQSLQTPRFHRAKFEIENIKAKFRFAGFLLLAAQQQLFVKLS
eukprot:768440-Hanusia_phi.AAC.8